jgi:hypothetical protein
MTDATSRRPPPPSARALDLARAKAPPADPSTMVSADSVHEQMTRQVRALLADADMNEEEKQQMLIALSCPCCGTGGLSLRGKLGAGPVSF